MRKESFNMLTPILKAVPTDRSKADISVVFDFICSSAPFTEWPHSLSRKLASTAGYAELAPGSVIFREGDAANQVYILISGSVVVHGADVLLEGSR